MADRLPSPLVSVDDLARRLDDPDTIVVDVRWYLGRPGDGQAAYDAGHVPGAIHLDLDGDLADLAGLGAPGRHPLPDPAAFAAHLGAAGIGDETFVVAYDDAGGWVAARLWWMLDNLGHRGGEAVLDGGWQAWLAAGRPTTTDVPRRATRRLTLAPAWTNVLARDELAGRLGELTLLDARAAPRYRGEMEPIDPIAGHIPTALSAPWDGNVGPDGRFLPAEALRSRVEALRAASPAGGAAPVVTYCGSGTSACHHSLAMRLAGLPDPILYAGSYSDWSRSGMPIATGADPGTPPPGLPERGSAR
ncbi:MAG TPA: sulfurtransferase [Candidatus Acidoferrales bacterium]|nr:sulfurtransferase [Candidatus Acidoferrales bacterium]